MNDSRVTQLIQEAIVQRYSRRDILRRATALGLSASAIGTLLAACGGGNAATPTAQTASSAASGSGATPVVAAQPTAASQSAVAASGGTQILRRPGMEPMDFDTAIIGGGVGIEMFFFLFEGLTFYDWDSKKVLPAAAESWDVSDDKLDLYVPSAQGHGLERWLAADGARFRVRHQAQSRSGARRHRSTSFVFPIKGARGLQHQQDHRPEHRRGHGEGRPHPRDDPDRRHAVLAGDPLPLDDLADQQEIGRQGRRRSWTEPAKSSSATAATRWTRGRTTRSMVLVPQREVSTATNRRSDRIEYTLFQNPDAQGSDRVSDRRIDRAKVIATSADFVTSEPTLSKLARQVPISGTWQLRTGSCPTTNRP